MAVNTAKREGVQVKLYSIIYELIDQMKEAMAGLLDPEHRETVIGHAEVKQIFKLSKGIVAGCLVTDGRIARTARARVLRRRQPVYDGGLSTLRRFQDDVKEVRVGLECGINDAGYNMKHRLLRVNELLKRELSSIITREITFEGVLVTLNQVDVTPDLKHAHAYVSILGKEGQAAAMALLEENRVILQTALAKSVTLKYTPQLIFHLDDSIERGARVFEILQQIDIPPAEKE
jgi:ribosome-binding factor A